MAMACAEAGIRIVGKLVEYSAEPIKKQMKYLCCYSCNVQTLSDEFQELNFKQRSLQGSVNQALANNDIITAEVENWLKKVEDLKTSSQNILAEAEEHKVITRRFCFCKKWLPEIHYFLSRKALKTAKECIQYRNIEFSIISNLEISADIPDITPTSNYIKYESRVSFEDKILKALKDPNVHSIGIWGIGGVGKTVMAKTIRKRVRDEKIFERVVMVIVSQQPNIREMQRHIAGELGLIFKGDSPDSQTKQLHKRLKTEMSLLIIFDDLWLRLDLEDFGIPSHCKLMLTSRNKDALTSSSIPSPIIFELRILNESESWNFFVDNLGFNVVDDDDDDDQEFVQIAKKVERECKGLPLALMIVASALKDKHKFFWNNALRELQSHAPENIPNVIKDVYESLQFSINALQDLSNLPRMKIAKGYNNNEVDQEYLISKDVRILGINFNFCRLRYLKVHNIGNFKCMFSLSIIGELLNLSCLHVENCSLLEQIIEKNDGNVRRLIIFPNLKRIRLSNLPIIRNFCYNDILFPSLWSIRIERCPLMLKFVEEVEDQISSSTTLFDQRVECPKLSSLYLKSLNISEAFSSSFFFKSLTVLKYLEIRDCEKFKCVISEEKEEGEISVKSLDVNNLSKLHGSISSMRKGLKFPLLEEVSIKDCPMLEKFSQTESIHFPNLRTVRGFINAEFAAKFFYHKPVSSEEICTDKKYFIISVRDISFNLDGDFYNFDDERHWLTPHESESFLYGASFKMKKEIVGKFKIGEEKKIGEGIEYEVMLMMMKWDEYFWKVPIEIELKQKLLPQQIKFQRTEIFSNHPSNTWIEVSIGKFVTKLQQREKDDEFEFSMQQHPSIFDTTFKYLDIKGIRFVQV